MIEYDTELFVDTDPVSWAVDICKKNARNGLRIEAMESAFAGKNNPNCDPDSTAIIHCDPTNDKVVDGILKGIVKGYAGHASISLLQMYSVTGYNYFEPAYDLYKHSFRNVLDKIYQVGHYTHATLWFSASRHVYEAHIDLEDGFLFQLTGSKSVKVWDFPDDHSTTELFDYKYLDRYTDRAYRESLPYKEFHLTAGQVLYIPAGAVHEVTTDEGLTSVSISYHLGCPYPALTLCSDLAKVYKNHQFNLPEQYSGTLKRTVTLMNPHYESLPAKSEMNRMPDALRERLCQIIQSDCDESELAAMLDKWWLEKLDKPTYAGPFDQISVFPPSA